MFIKYDCAILFYFLNVAVQIVLMAHINAAAVTGKMAHQVWIGRGKTVSVLRFWPCVVYKLRQVRKRR